MGHYGIPYKIMFGVSPDIHHIRKFGALACYEEDGEGCKIYFHEGHTATRVADLLVAEDVVYRDRHDLVDDADTDSLLFEHIKSSMMASAANEPRSLQPRELEGGEEVGKQDVYYGITAAVGYVGAEAAESRETKQTMANAAHLTGIEGITAAVSTELEPAHAQLTTSSLSQELMPNADTEDCENQHEDKVTRFNGNKSAIGICGSIAESEQPDGIDESVQVEDIEDEDATIVQDESVVDDDQARLENGQTNPKEWRFKQDTDKQEPKRTRTSIASSAVPVILPILVSNVEVPINSREMSRLKYRQSWLQADLEEKSALRAKGVIREIPCEDVPKDAKSINTRWARFLNADRQEYAVRFKSRLVALGNYQRLGIDFFETFVPVARMSSFRMFVALAAVLPFLLYGKYINTAYPNALLGIRQYLTSIEGFPGR
ncbi:Reverse transcriptase [Phytophthora palmivora]|uniref:Reverse transcriptase n=1 Tax=Phytophthora palmivora TaxID=4796 RepID=A0A2P4WZX7_9STRA|nr:Reverse transcriptase [Phytophthora palmivora]